MTQQILDPVPELILEVERISEFCEDLDRRIENLEEIFCDIFRLLRAAF